MSRIRILVCRDDDDNPDVTSEIASFDMPEANIDTLKRETALDDLEATTYEIGTAVLRCVLQARWEEMDKQLAEKSRQAFPPSKREGRRAPSR
jgi:hypothetical protein